MSAYPTQRALSVVPDTEPDVPADDPDGAIPWPTVLLEGSEKAGKSYELALFSGCGEFSQTWWIEVGMEGTARMYSRVPGASYKIVRHSGSIPEIMDRLADIHRHAVWSNATGRKPVLVVVDSGGAIWRITQAWVDWKARQTDDARRKLARNPNAEISAPINIRNAGTAMWTKFIAALNDIPAVKVVTSRGQEVTKFKNGQPTTEKGWSVVGHKEFGFDVDIWCRLVRNEPAEIIGIRAVVDGIRPGDDAFATEKIHRSEFSLRWLVFDRYSLNSSTAYVRPRNDTDDVKLADPHAVDHVDEDGERRQQQRFNDDVIVQAAQLWDDARKTNDKATFTALWKEAKDKGWGQVPLIDNKGGQTQPLVELLTIEAKRISELDKQRAAGEPAVTAAAAPEPASPKRPEIEQLLFKCSVPSADWLTVVSGMVGRQVKDLAHDLRGEPRELVLDELRNWAVLGDARNPLVQDALAAGQQILGRVQGVA